MKNFTEIKYELEAISLPIKPSISELNALLELLYPLFLKLPPDVSKNRDEWSCYWEAKKMFEQILWDDNFENRNGIQNSWAQAKLQGKSLSEFLNRYTKEEKQPVSNIENKVLQQIYNELGYATVVEISGDATELNNALQPYFLWMEKQLIHNPYSHFPIVWNVFQFSKKPVLQSFIQWFSVLEKKQVVATNFSNHIYEAIHWEQFFNTSNFIEKTTKQDFDQWLVLLDNANPVLRGIAAKCIGAVYTDWQDEEDAFKAHQHITITDMLQLLYQKQVAGKNVVGGFINGCCIDGCLKNLEEHALLVAQNFDVKSWLLKTAIDSPEFEPYIPGSQAFWFYLHEYFDWDAAACHQLIDGKRYWLALMCATESLPYGAYKVMQPILKRLENEAPQDIIEETKRHIAIYFKHYHTEK